MNSLLQILLGQNVTFRSGRQEIISDRGWGEWNLETSVFKHFAFVHLLGLKSQSYYTSVRKELGGYLQVQAGRLGVCKSSS